jgi:hypothetical protein
MLRLARNNLKQYRERCSEILERCCLAFDPRRGKTKPIRGTLDRTEFVLRRKLAHDRLLVEYNPMRLR